MFVFVIIEGASLENGNAAPTDGRISMFIRESPVTGVTLRTISTWLCDVSIFVLVVSSVLAIYLLSRTGVVPEIHVRVSGPNVGVKKTIFNFSKSIEGAPGARLMENLISSIPVAGLEAIP